MSNFWTGSAEPRGFPPTPPLSVSVCVNRRVTRYFVDIRYRVNIMASKRMDTYVKVFQSILDSTIWQEDLATKVVWITVLAMKDRNGYVGASVPGLARRAGVSLEECEAALAKFKAPDAYSRTRDFEGRRIEEVPGGWRVLNHTFYRNKLSPEDRREYQRVKQAEYRKRRKERRDLVMGAQCDGAGEAIRDGFKDLEDEDGVDPGQDGTVVG